MIPVALMWAVTTTCATHQLYSDCVAPLSPCPDGGLDDQDAVLFLIGDAGDKEFARVTKKWAGAGMELLTSADNYVLEISHDVSPDSRVRVLILAAVMCIDMVLKE